jgi:hypothetical protein
VSGYVLDTTVRNESKNYRSFATHICPPYTVVKWNGGVPAVLSAACDGRRYWGKNVTLSFGSSQLLTPITDPLSIIRYDFSRGTIHTYWRGVITGFDGKTFQRIDAIYVDTIDDFHMGNGKIFTSHGGNVTVYDKNGSHTLIYKRPKDQSEEVGVYYVHHAAPSLSSRMAGGNYPVIEFILLSAFTALVVLFYLSMQWMCCTGLVKDWYRGMETVRKERERIAKRSQTTGERLV